MTELARRPAAPTPGEVVGRRRDASVEDTPDTAPDVAGTIDVLEEQFANTEPLRGDNAIDRATSRLVRIATSMQQRRLTAQNRRDARNELHTLNVESIDSDDARATYESRVLDLLDSDDTKIAGYAQNHADSEFGRLNREVWREDAKNKLKSLGRSALRGVKFGTSVAVGATILGAEAAGKGIKRGAEVSVAKANEFANTASSNWDGAKEALAYQKERAKNERQKRADKAAPELLKRQREAAERAAKAAERKATRKDLLRQLASSYTEGAMQRTRAEKKEPTPTEMTERQRVRTSSLGNLAIKFGAAREAFKNASVKDIDPNQNKLF